MPNGTTCSAQDLHRHRGAPVRNGYLERAEFPWELINKIENARFSSRRIAETGTGTRRICLRRRASIVAAAVPAAGEVSVTHQLQRANRQLYHRETKTEDSSVVLPLPAICLAALGSHRTTQDRAREVAGPAWQPGSWVMCTRYGSPIEPRNFNRSFAARCEAAGVRRITVHDARRTCATLLVDLDVHPRVIMQILRRAQFAVTMETYAKASTKATREALRRLGDQLEEPHETEEAN